MNTDLELENVENILNDLELENEVYDEVKEADNKNLMTVSEKLISYNEKRLQNKNEMKEKDMEELFTQQEFRIEHQERIIKELLRELQNRKWVDAKAKQKQEFDDELLRVLQNTNGRGENGNN